MFKQENRVVECRWHTCTCLRVDLEAKSSVDVCIQRECFQRSCFLWWPATTLIQGQVNMLTLLMALVQSIWPSYCKAVLLQCMHDDLILESTQTSTLPMCRCVYMSSLMVNIVFDDELCQPYMPMECSFISQWYMQSIIHVICLVCWNLYDYEVVNDFCAIPDQMSV